MAEETIDGKTRQEWFDHYVTAWKMTEETAREAVAITFGDTPGDVIDLDEHPEFGEDNE